MKKYLFFLLVYFISGSGKSQLLNLQDNVTGKPIFSNQYEDVIGSALLFDDWTHATLLGKNGVRYYNYQVKLDVYKNTFYFLHNNQMFEFVTDILEVEMHPDIADSSTYLLFRKGYTNIPLISTHTFCKVLVDGTITGIELLSKQVNDVYEYGSANKTRQFSSNSEIFFIKDRVVFKEKISKKLMEQLTNDKKEYIQNFISAQSLNLKINSDVLKVISYYNQLVAK